MDAGVWLTRSAGCVINDYAGRWMAPQVERTRDRPLAAGAVSGLDALAVFAVLRYRLDQPRWRDPP